MENEKTTIVERTKLSNIDYYLIKNKNNQPLYTNNRMLIFLSRKDATNWLEKYEPNRGRRIFKIRLFEVKEKEREADDIFNINYYEDNYPIAN